MDAKRKYDNEVAWLSGVYIHSAVVSAIAGAFGNEVEYMQVIDFDELERKANLTEEEKLQEAQKLAVQSSRLQMANVMALIKQNKEEGE